MGRLQGSAAVLARSLDRVGRDGAGNQCHRRRPTGGAHPSSGRRYAQIGMRTVGGRRRAGFALRRTVVAPRWSCAVSTMSELLVLTSALRYGEIADVPTAMWVIPLVALTVFAVTLLIDRTLPSRPERPGQGERPAPPERPARIGRQPHSGPLRYGRRASDRPSATGGAVGRRASDRQTADSTSVSGRHAEHLSQTTRTMRQEAIKLRSDATRVARVDRVQARRMLELAEEIDEMALLTACEAARSS